MSGRVQTLELQSVFNFNLITMEKIKVTKEEFQRYENLRKSGVTNMWDIDFVMSVTWLSKEKVLYIMKNYKELSKLYLI